MYVPSLAYEVGQTQVKLSLIMSRQLARKDFAKLSACCSSRACRGIIRHMQNVGLPSGQRWCKACATSADSDRLLLFYRLTSLALCTLCTVYAPFPCEGSDLACCMCGASVAWPAEMRPELLADEKRESILQLLKELRFLTEQTSINPKGCNELLACATRLTVCAEMEALLAVLAHVWLCLCMSLCASEQYTCKPHHCRKSVRNLGSHIG